MNNDFPSSKSEIHAVVGGLKVYCWQHGLIAFLNFCAFILLCYSSDIINFINKFKCNVTESYGDFILLSVLVLIIWYCDSLFISEYKKRFIPKGIKRDNKNELKDYKTYENYSAFSKQWLNVLTIISFLLSIITINGIGVIGYGIVCIIMFATFNIYLRRSEIDLYTLKIKCEDSD